MGRRLVLTAAVLGLLVTAGTALASEGFPYRRVRLGATSGCWPVATTMALQDEGLMGVRHPARPMLFVFPQAASVAFWMENTPAPLTGAWVGAANTVIGHWHGVPNTNTQHLPPAPVIAVVEYPVGWRVPADSARLTMGGSCSSRGPL